MEWKGKRGVQWINVCRTNKASEHQNVTPSSQEKHLYVPTGTIIVTLAAQINQFYILEASFSLSLLSARMAELTSAPKGC